jgi:hypothetical protein
MDSFNRLRTLTVKSFGEISELIVQVFSDVRAVEETIARHASTIAGQSNRIKELEILVAQLRNQKEIAQSSFAAEKQFSEQEQAEKKKLLEEVAELRSKLALAELKLSECHPAWLKKKAEERRTKAAELLEEAAKLEQEASKE